MKTLLVPLLLASALLAGVAIGYFARPSQTITPAAGEKAEERRILADKGETASVRALRKRISELEKQLRAVREQAEPSVSNAVGEAFAKMPPDAERPRGNPREWMENLKKNDPARYAQMTNRIAGWRRRHAERTQSRLAFFSSIDVSRMSAGARKTHDELQECLLRREEIENQLHQEGLSDELRQDLMERLRETERDTRRLNGEERRNLIEETARTLGFEGSAVQEISSTLQQVIEATDGRGGFGPPPPQP